MGKQLYSCRGCNSVFHYYASKIPSSCPRCSATGSATRGGRWYEGVDQ